MIYLQRNIAWRRFKNNIYFNKSPLVVRNGVKIKLRYLFRRDINNLFGIELHYVHLIHVICLHYLLTEILNEFQLIIELINLHVNK